MHPAGLGRAATVGVMAVVALGACSNSSGSPRRAREPRFDPHAAAEKIRAVGSIAIVGEGRVGRETAPIRGRIEYQPYRLQEQIPVNSGTYLSEIQFRRIGDVAWIRRAPVSDPGVITFGVPLLAFRAGQSRPFLAIPNPDVGVPAMVAQVYDPVRFLDRLGAAKQMVHFESGPGSTVAGARRSTFRARLPVSLAHSVGVESVTVWVDGKGRPVQLGFTTESRMVGRYQIRKAGGPFAVSVPPASEVEGPNQPLPDAIGPYVPVFRSSAGGTPVAILRAPGRDDWTCWKVDSDQPAALTGDQRPGGGICIPPVLDTASDDERFAIPIDADATASYELIGILVPPGSTVEVVLANRQRMPMTVDQSGLAVYAGAAQPPAALVTVHTPSGTNLVCGPGPINSLGDVDAISSPESLRGLPWNCLSQESADQLGGAGNG